MGRRGAAGWGAFQPQTHSGGRLPRKRGSARQPPSPAPGLPRGASSPQPPEALGRREGANGACAQRRLGGGSGSAMAAPFGTAGGGLGALVSGGAGKRAGGVGEVPPNLTLSPSHPRRALEKQLLLPTRSRCRRRPSGTT